MQSRCRKRYNHFCCSKWIPTLLLLLSIVIIYFPSPSLSSIPYSPSCSSNQFFDPTIMQCNNCTTTGTIASQNTNTCICANGYINDPILRCQSCSTGVSSSNRNICMGCDPTTTLGISTNQECICPTNHKIVETDSVGNYLLNKTCVNCGTVAYVNPSNPYECISCPDPLMTVVSGICDCDNWGNSCIYKPVLNLIISRYSPNVAFAMKIQQIYTSSSSSTSESIQSLVMTQYFYKAATQCKQFQISSACQTLANLCVLARYDSSNAACDYLTFLQTTGTNYINGVNGWYNGYPWLTYQGATSSILQNSEIASLVNFNLPKPTFILAAFSLNGTYLGTSIMTNELNLCSYSNSDLIQNSFLTFGNNYYKTCTLQLSSLLTMPQANFYDIYYLDGAHLYPVPILIVGNSQTVETALASNKLYRRFVVFDTMSGVRSSDTTPYIIQFVSSVKFIFSLRSSQQINPPLLVLQYSARYTASISTSDDLYRPTVQVSASYSFDSSPLWITTAVVTIIAIIATLFLSAYFIFLYCRRKYSSLFEFKIVVRFILYIFSGPSYAILCLIMLLSVVWFILYKLQTYPLVLTPQFNNDTIYYICFIIVALITLSLDVIHKIAVQCSIDIFFIDWEKSRGKLSSNSRGRTITDSYAPVSIWRSIYISKVWKKLQNSTIVSTEITYLIVLFFTVGLNLYLVDASQIEKQGIYSAFFQTNPMFRFALVILCWIPAYAIQYAFNYFIFYRFVENPVTMFMDLCSLSNISVMILLEDQYGYYIHGESVHSHADCNMKEFNMNLERERENIVVNRGLIVSNNSNGNKAVPCQSFQMYLTPQFREELKQRYLISTLIKSQKKSEEDANQKSVTQSTETTNTTRNNNTIIKSGEETSKEYPRFYDVINGRIPFLMKFNVPSESMIETYTAVNAFLKQFITGVL